jgi:hypothetical protein
LGICLDPGHIYEEDVEITGKSEHEAEKGSQFADGVRELKTRIFMERIHKEICLE